MTGLAGPSFALFAASDSCADAWQASHITDIEWQRSSANHRLIRQNETGRLLPTGLFRARSAADADFLDHPVVVAPVLDQFDMAAMMPMVAAILATLVVTELHAVVLVVTILVVVIVPVVAAILATLVITELLVAVLIVTILVVIVIPVMMAADDDHAVVGRIGR
ncbi:hypothetical protein ACFFNA_19350 [Mesorhizobium kowhaii]|uniref:hypothetical protein n=1 Tax=Mesorhizobium kowhaii TaxID=1300272 RepID=UPI0035F0CFEB